MNKKSLKITGLLCAYGVLQGLRKEGVLWNWRFIVDIRRWREVLRRRSWFLRMGVCLVLEPGSLLMVMWLSRMGL